MNLDLKADKNRYQPRPWIREPQFWAVAIYRFGRWGDAQQSPIARRVIDRAYWAAFQASQILLGISLPKSCEIGPGLLIHHFGGIVVHADVVIGSNCTLRHGVTIGERQSGAGVPKVGDNVEIGVGAILLGPISIGEGALIGAGALVLKDVPPHGVAKAPLADISINS